LPQSWYVARVSMLPTVMLAIPSTVLACLHVQHLGGRVRHRRLLGWAARSPQVLSCARDARRTLDLLWYKHHTVAGRWPTVLIRSRPIQVGERARRSLCIGAAPNGIEIGHPSPL
jgi:hypothetical protein